MARSRLGGLPAERNSHARYPHHLIHHLRVYFRRGRFSTDVAPLQLPASPRRPPGHRSTHTHLRALLFPPSTLRLAPSVHRPLLIPHRSVHPHLADGHLWLG